MLRGFSARDRCSKAAFGRNRLKINRFLFVTYYLIQKCNDPNYRIVTLFIPAPFRSGFLFQTRQQGEEGTEEEEKFAEFEPQRTVAAVLLGFDGVDADTQPAGNLGALEPGDRKADDPALLRRQGVDVAVKPADNLLPDHSGKQSGIGFGIEVGGETSSRTCCSCMFRNNDSRLLRSRR